MKLLSTKGGQGSWSFTQAVVAGMPPDGGLFWPASIPAFPSGFLQRKQEIPFPQIALETARIFLADEIPDRDLKEIIAQSMTFPVPLVTLDSGLSILELFHGPTLAFKDFGARFLAHTLDFIHQGIDATTTILVATSGDTGGAVAWSCAGLKNLRVVVLYPRGRVSPLQELQLTTAGPNTLAIAVDGGFDECQHLVKRAFADTELRAKVRLTTANSINIARLIPQTFYYIAAWMSAPDGRKPGTFSVPSGNLGNLTAGLLAKTMGLPITRFIAAMNINGILGEFLASGIPVPRPSRLTVSNAMDIGDPSNLARIRSLFHDDLPAMNSILSPVTISDEKTLKTIEEVYARHGYVLDPHAAVGYAAAREYRGRTRNDEPIVVLATAHPAKFLDAFREDVRRAIPVPPQLRDLEGRPQECRPMGTSYEELRSILFAHQGK